MDDKQARLDRIRELIRDDSDDLTIDDAEWFLDHASYEPDWRETAYYLIKQIRRLAPYRKGRQTFRDFLP